MLNGDSLNIAALRGNVLLINFWAPDNIGAQKTSHLALLFEKYSKATGFKILNICVECQADRIHSWLEKNPMPGIQAMSNFDDILSYGIDAVPAYAILDRQGRICDKTVHGAVERIYVFFYIDGVLSTLLQNEQKRDTCRAPRIYELQGDLRLFDKDSSAAIQLYNKSYAENPENLRLAINLAKLIEPRNPASADSIFDDAFDKLLKRYPFALSIGSARAYICALELMQHYKKTSDPAKVDSLKKFRDYFENRPTKPQHSPTIQFRKNLADLTHSLLSIQTGDSSRLGVILTRTGYIITPTLFSDDSFYINSGDYKAPLAVIGKDSFITLLKLNNQQFLRPIDSCDGAPKADDNFFYAVVHDSSVSFCRHRSNDFIAISGVGKRRVKRDPNEEPGGFLFDADGRLAGMTPMQQDNNDSLMFITAASLLKHVERLGFEKIFEENVFPKADFDFSRFVLPSDTCNSVNSILFHVDVPKQGLFAVYAHVKTRSKRENVRVTLSDRDHSWTLKNLMHGAQWRPLIFDDQRPQGISVIKIDKGGLNLFFETEKIKIDSLYISSNLEPNTIITKHTANTRGAGSTNLTQKEE